MIEPKIDDLLAQVDSKYTLVILPKRRENRSTTSSAMGAGCPPRRETGAEVALSPSGSRGRSSPSDLKGLAARSRRGSCSASRAASPPTGLFPRLMTRVAPLSGRHDALMTRFVGPDTFAASSGRRVSRICGKRRGRAARAARAT
jgi:hypothetical protein